MTVVIAIRPLETWGPGSVAAAVIVAALALGLLAWAVLVILRR